MSWSGGNSLSLYTYLADVEYQVQAHFVWNEAQPQLADDRNENKHHNIAKRMVERGGRARHLSRYPRMSGLCGKGWSLEADRAPMDGIPHLAYPTMFHGFDYPMPADKHFSARFWSPVMKKGVIDFCLPESCPTRRIIRAMPHDVLQTSGWKEEALCNELDA